MPSAAQFSCLLATRGANRMGIIVRNPTGGNGLMQLTLALYTGPISNLVGLRAHTCFFSSSAFVKEL